jgi:hypothetical protein
LAELYALKRVDTACSLSIVWLIDVVGTVEVEVVMATS